MNRFPRLTLALLTAVLALAPALQAQRTNPKPVTVSQPKYPTELVDSGLSGTASVSFVVKADGSVTDPVLKSADHPAFGTEAMAVITQWKFEPGTRDGAAVDTPVEIPIQFRAPFDQKINALAKRKVFQPLSEPAMTQKEYKSKLKVKSKARPAYPPTLAKSGVKEDVKVNFVVTPDGTTINPQFEKEPNVQLLVPSIAAIAQMTYEPPKKGGKGVYVEATETLHFEEPPPAPKGAKGKGGRGGGGGGGPDVGGAGDP
jgi:TonB family protein